MITKPFIPIPYPLQKSEENCNNDGGIQNKYEDV
jgi:hypothetical protein